MFPLLELQSEGMHGGMMVSKWQCHPSSRCEVVAQTHVIGEHTWCKSHHKRLPRNSVKKKKVVLYTITIMVGVFCRAVLAIVDPISKNSLIFVYIPSEICSLTIIHLCVSCATICTFVIYQ